MTAPTEPRAPSARAAQAADDHAAVSALLVQYSTAIDTKDWKLFADCFEPDCQTQYQERRFNGVQRLTDVMRRLHDPLDASLHRLTNVDVRLDGDHANVRAYVDALLVRRDHPDGPLYRVAGTYDDLVVRTDGSWRFRRRIFRDVWTWERTVATRTLPVAADEITAENGDQSIRATGNADDERLTQ